MADKNIGALAAVAEAAIGGLPGIAELYDDSLLAVEQQGEARHMTGRQWKIYAQAGVKKYVDDAQKAADDAMAAVGQVGTAVEDTRANAAEAEASAQKAQQYSGKPPIIQNGTWWTWNAARQAYVDTGGAARGSAGPEGPKGDTGDTGPQGPRGEKGDSGTSFTVKGRFDTLEELNAVHPAGAAGDAYAVGAAEDNTIYLWSVDMAEWQDVGPLQGPPGPQGEPGAQGPQGLRGETGPVGPQGPAGADGAAGSMGPAGPGVPAGGTAGQVLAKRTGADFDTEWKDPGAPGGDISLENIVSVAGGAEMELAGDFGDAPFTITVTEEAEYGSGGSGVGKSLAGQTVEPMENETIVANEGAEIFNDYREREFEDSSWGTRIPSAGNVASDYYSHAEGMRTTASATGAHAEGVLAVASGHASHAEGQNCQATGNFSHAEGAGSIASGVCSHAENGCVASNASAHAEGISTEASGLAAHSEGANTLASGNFSHSQNEYTIAAGFAQTAMGRFNIESTQNTDKLIIGKGTGLDNGTYSANCFRATDTGVYASGNYNASGADYAEMFEWADGNPDGEDRAGRFVTLDGAKIRLAGPEDDYIIGIVSGNPSVVGDVHDDQWQGMYLYDVFGRPLWEDVEVPGLAGPDGAVMIPARVERRQKINPDYNAGQPYKPRSGRPEWDAVGMLGKLVAVDDGGCAAGGWCAVGAGGIAVRSEGRTKYRVMERLDDRHIRVLIL